jgi:mannose-6-phosphate isomerase-like protein (cupin superfamily)
MTVRALFVAGSHVTPVANDVPVNSPYRASVRVLSPGETSPAVSEENAEVLLFVERGTIELMVRGASFPLGKTQTARIPPGTLFAYRNIGNTDARVSHAMIPPKAKSDCPTTVTVAA